MAFETRRYRVEEGPLRRASLAAILKLPQKLLALIRTVQVAPTLIFSNFSSTRHDIRAEG